MLKGYKTYIVAGIAVISAVGGYLTGDLSLADTIQAILASGAVAALRDAIAKK